MSKFIPVHRHFNIEFTSETPSDAHEQSKNISKSGVSPRDMDQTSASPAALAEATHAG
jgi:hypothetical protein